MMILSRAWYVVLSLLLGAAVYVLYIAAGRYDQHNSSAADQALRADSQSVHWALQVDARRRLDALLLVAVDSAIGKGLRGANARDSIPASSKEEVAKALRGYNEKLPVDYKNDALLVADREGRLVAHLGYDAVSSFPEFELGGYPAVFDAIHGFLRDDTWVLGGKIARIVARPVEDEVGQPPLGAVVGLRWVDAAYAKEISKRTGTNIAFFAAGQSVAHASTADGFEERLLGWVQGELGAVALDRQFRESGRTDARPLREPLSTQPSAAAVFMKLAGDAWDLNAGFAVVRSKALLGGPLGFLLGADDQDKRYVPWWLVAALVAAGVLGGVVLTFIEHGWPLREMAQQARRLRDGDIDQLQLPRFRGAYRPLARDVNAGIQRIVEKGGGLARRPADLESILGPVPVQPSMSAFSFPLAGGSPAPPSTRGNPGLQLAPPPAPAPPAPPPPPFPPSSAPSSPPSHASSNAARPPGLPSLGASIVPTPSVPPLGQSIPIPASSLRARREEDLTQITSPNADLIAASGASGVEGAVEWYRVFQEFLETKRACGETTETLTFDRFQQTLTKNRDALIERHGCKHVRFAVYVKEGRASLKAIPVRE